MNRAFIRLFIATAFLVVCIASAKFIAIADSKQEATENCGGISMFISYSSETIRNGTMTCASDMDTLMLSANPPGSDPLSKADVVDVFIAMFNYYSKAQTYVTYFKAGEVYHSRRYTISGSAIRSAIIGRGESGDLHFNRDKIARAITFYEDGLRQANW